MDITFVLCPNIIGLLCLILLLTFTRFNFYLEKQKLMLFVIAAVCNICIIGFGVADYMLAEAAFAAAVPLRRMTSAVTFALTPVIPLLIARIATRKDLPRWTLLPALINIIISVSSIFTGHMFSIDSSNFYHRGPLFAVMVVISAFYLLLVIYVSIHNLRSVHAGETTFLFGIVFVMLLVNTLEIVFSFHFVTWNCCAVLLMCYYLFLHIQYFKFDPLTSVFNRNMFNFDVENIGHKANVCIISFDLNGLKQINDAQGHEQGDAYIIACARLIDRCFSDAGRLYRVGGDEFVVLLVNTTQDAVLKRIAHFEQTCKESGASVACGFSYADTPSDISQMLRAADDAMYQNKRERMLNR